MKVDPRTQKLLKLMFREGFQAGQNKSYGSNVTLDQIDVEFGKSVAFVNDALQLAGDAEGLNFIEKNGEVVNPQ